VPKKIQCSQATADLLIASGKSHWISKRDELVQAKGKGEVTTFWVHPQRERSNLSESRVFGASKRSLANTARGLKRSISTSSTRTMSIRWDDSLDFVELSAVVETHKYQRLIDWNTDVLAGLLKKILAKRTRADAFRRSNSQLHGADSSPTDPAVHPVDEVTEAILMPQFDPKAAKVHSDPSSVDLPAIVIAQLKRYVTAIADMYHDENAFHQYVHASHVTMSANK
jgi:hypothetical protein